jgi:hypothetical protein
MSLLSSPEMVALVERDRAREAAQSRLARIARLARRCSAAPASFADRIERALRPSTQAC